MLPRAMVLLGKAWRWMKELVRGILLLVFGSRNERYLRSLGPTVAAINAVEPEMQRLSDAELRAKTDEFRARLEQGETVDDILPEAFAAAREAARRTVGMRHFDVQLMGGIVLHQGKVAEMATGEGKTLVATLPAYLNALAGKGVYIITVNDYLAERDRNWMGPVYEFLGLSVGVIKAFMPKDERIDAYRADITYGQNNEFGFDYLRDNMEARLEDQVQKRLHYAIVDEVDSILIDEARTPLIISGPAYESTDKYYQADQCARRLKRDVDFKVEEKEHRVTLTDEGTEKAERFIGVDSFYTAGNMDWPHYIDQALRAHHLYERDKEYIVTEGRAVIVDEFTGRLMEGRQWSDGLHQAVEAKEHLKIKQENQTLATITFQNYFRLFSKLAGMTGTAMTEAAELYKIYGLDVIVVATNRPLIRDNQPDAIYLRREDKFSAIIDEIVRSHDEGRPILVGTTSIEKSEQLSRGLQKRGLEHEVLNAKHHAREAEIVKKAGQWGNVTIATNMAGRGTDIVLGEGVADIGGLHIVGTERHEARRIDNQLRGRAGRQGDPGSSKFFLSLEDDLMRVFAPEWASRLLERFGMDGGEALEHTMVSNAIGRAQKRVEAHNFEIRKNLLEYDEVMDEQRKIIYSQRQDVLRGENLDEITLNLVSDSVDRNVQLYLPNESRASESDRDGLVAWANRSFQFDLKPDDLNGKSWQQIADEILENARQTLEQRKEVLGPQLFGRLAQFVLAQTIDTKWKDHLHNMDQLRHGIGLRAYGQLDPKRQYKMEAYSMFQDMSQAICDGVANLILRVQVERRDEAEEGLAFARSRWDAQDFVHSEMSSFQRSREAAVAASHAQSAERVEPYVRKAAKVGRNDPCPCGSGKKYKKCCGARE